MRIAAYPIYIPLLLGTTLVMGGPPVVESSTSVNLIQNPSAEVGIPAEDHPAGKRAGSTMLPQGWGCYNHAGTSKWGLTTDGPRSGGSAVFLQYIKPSGDVAETGYNRAEMGIMLCEGNGADAAGAMALDPDKDYEFGFWIKGDIRCVHVLIMSWRSENGGTSDRSTYAPNTYSMRRNGKVFPFYQNIRNLNRTILPTSEWTLYTGRFRPKANAKRTALCVGFRDVVLLAPGQTIFLDDAFIRPVAEE